MDTLFERLFQEQSIDCCIGGCLLTKDCMQGLSNIGRLCAGDTGDISAQGSGKMDGQEIGNKLCQDGRQFKNSVLIMRYRAMAGPTMCPHAEADCAFLCGLHRIVAATTDHKTTSTTFIEGVLGLNQLWPLLPNPT